MISKREAAFEIAFDSYLTKKLVSRPLLERSYPLD